MLAPIVTGLVAALIAAFPALIRSVFPGVAWASPIFMLGIAAAAMVIQRFVLDRKSGYRGYDGLADLLIHIHSPASPDSPARWSARGAISFLLTLFGGSAGPEGAAVELTHALSIRSRPRSAKWFEQRRRTDAATSLASGIAAAFHAPFAALLLPMELGIGVRHIYAALAAVVAFLANKTLLGLFPDLLREENFDLSGALYGFHFIGVREWISLAIITVAVGAIGAGVIRFIRYSQESLLDLFQTQAWIRTLAGGILLFLVVLVYRPGHLPSTSLLEQVVWNRKAAGELGLLFFTHLLSLALILSAFGTIGVFWPFFALGACLGAWSDQALFHGIPGFTAASALAGGAAIWGAVLGAPLAGSVLAFELTGNLNLLLPCLIAGFGARQVRAWLKTAPLVSKDLEARGVSLIEGRSASVLDSILVRDAMVADHETVHEQEPVSEIYSRLLKSRYPFLPVVNNQGTYLGLLTVDMVQEGWRAQDPLASNSPLSKLLEAKDLLYRAGFKTPTVKPNDRLSATSGMFERVPCVPVIGDDGRVLGLLFVYSVRLAYDREVAKRSLAFHLED